MQNTLDAYRYYDAALYYHTHYGCNVLPIGKEKAPVVNEWDTWQENEQTQEQIETMQYGKEHKVDSWAIATGVGIVQGIKGFRCIDIDTGKWNDVILLLQYLHLSTNYEWVVKTGRGWHIYVRCFDSLPSTWKTTNKGHKCEAVFTLPNPEDKDNPLKRIELRWHKCQCVVPPSIHPSGKVYSFLNCTDTAYPSTDPAVVHIDDLIAAIQIIAPESDDIISPKTSKEITPDVEYVEVPVIDNRVKSYANAVLYGEVTKLENQHEGERNNTLYNAAIRLGFFVHNGALDEEVVRKELTKAALASGLEEDEIEKAIDSGFNNAEGEPLKLPSWQEQFRNNEGGNADRFVHYKGEDFKYCGKLGWLAWDGKCWKTVEDTYVEGIGLEVIREIYREAAGTQDDKKRTELIAHALRSESIKNIRGMLSLAKTYKAIYVPRVDMFDAHPHLINCKNGTFNLRTGELQPHRREDLLTRYMPVDYNPAATCPKYMAMLDRVTGGDAELQEYIQKAIGYTLSGTAEEQLFFFLYGTGKNGKSTLVETFMEVFGDCSHKINISALLARREESGISELAYLRAKRMVVTSETQEGRRLNESLIKDLTGNDTISARMMYKDPFNFKATFAVWMYGNHKPTIRGTDEGIWRRVKCIPFEQVIPENERINKYYLILFLEEASGILNWIIEGYKKWKEEGLKDPAKVQEATKEYRVESDTIAQFVQEECEIKMQEGYTTTTRDLYKKYTEWCKEEKMVFPKANNVFGRHLAELAKEYGFEQGALSVGTRVWNGIRIRKKVVAGQQGFDYESRIN